MKEGVCGLGAITVVVARASCVSGIGLRGLHCQESRNRKGHKLTKAQDWPSERQVEVKEKSALLSSIDASMSLASHTALSASQKALLKRGLFSSNALRIFPDFSQEKL